MTQTRRKWLKKPPKWPKKPLPDPAETQINDARVKPKSSSHVQRGLKSPKKHPVGPLCPTSNSSKSCKKWIWTISKINVHNYWMFSNSTKPSDRQSMCLTMLQCDQNAPNTTTQKITASYQQYHHHAQQRTNIWHEHQLFHYSTLIVRFSLDAGCNFSWHPYILHGTQSVRPLTLTSALPLFDRLFRGFLTRPP